MGCTQAAADEAVSTITLTLFRNGKVFDAAVNLGLESGAGTDRLILWCGAQLQVRLDGDCLTWSLLS